jgi:splicing factor 3A subunit 2
MLDSMNIFVKDLSGKTSCASLPSSFELDDFIHHIWKSSYACSTRYTQCSSNGITSIAYLIHEGRVLESSNYHQLKDGSTVSIQLRLLGGIDRQNRVGSKFGGGGVSSSQNADRERKDRLKRLALESIDLAKDPYLMRNHLGTYECKLCLTLHPNEANYLAHTQGKKHQQGLARRAYLETKKAESEAALQPPQPPTKKVKIHKVRIGRPAYQVLKSRDPDTDQRCLSFELSFTEISASVQPRHRFMSAFEQQIDTPPDRRYQYLLIAADPYETVGFKIPNEPLDKREGKFVTHWDSDGKKFTLTLYYADEEDQKPEAK